MAISGVPLKSTKYVFYIDERNGRTRDMSLEDWESAMRDPNRKKDVMYWKMVRIVDLNQQGPIVTEGRVEYVPTEANELECPLCGYLADTKAKLRGHKLGKHK